MPEERNGNLKFTLELVGREEKGSLPELSVYLVGRGTKLAKRVELDKDAGFKLTKKDLKAARKIYIGPKAKDLSEVNKEALVVFGVATLLKAAEAKGILSIAKRHWCCWWPVKRCVHGSVRRCFPFRPPVLTPLASAIERRELVPTALEAGAQGIAEMRAVDSLVLARICGKVCDGLVEVYRRTCCCKPWVIRDPRLPELLEHLHDIVTRFPELPPKDPFPPGPWPGPDPSPKLVKNVIRDGTIDELRLNASTDLKNIQRMKASEVVDYINARPYLLCWHSCGKPVKVAQGRIEPDGSFDICWKECPRLMRIHCHDEFAYVVKQHVDGETITIYNGLAANKWFHYGDDAVLTSYDPRAVSCRDNSFPGDDVGAFVLLEDIGSTPSHRLHTPDADSWDGVQPPGINDGLVKTYYDDNCNWGATLPLQYHFSEPMKGLGAKYYRVSVSAANATGNPIGNRTYLAPGEWKYYEVVGTDIYVRRKSLGPATGLGVNHLYEIPYDADEDWQSGQFHAYLNTNAYDDGRFLVTVEVFDAAGNLLRPNGTAAPGGVASNQAGFTFRRWYQPVGPTAEVPYAALTHLFWWDNREAIAKIEDLRVGGTEHTEECQFLEASGASNFSVGYRAYHLEPKFHLYHTMWWKRGLGGSTGTLTSPHPNPNNVGVPPGPPHGSGTETFAIMLDGHEKCSFAVNLRTYVKTWNGSVRLLGLDHWDQAAFALQNTTP